MNHSYFFLLSAFLFPFMHSVYVDVAQLYGGEHCATSGQGAM